MVYLMHSKYSPDIARLFSWGVIREFYYQESLDIENNASPVCQLTSDADSRTFRLSLKAGVDLRPLIRECSYLTSYTYSSYHGRYHSFCLFIRAASHIIVVRFLGHSAG